MSKAKQVAVLSESEIFEGTLAKYILGQFDEALGELIYEGNLPSLLNLALTVNQLSNDGELLSPYR